MFERQRSFNRSALAMAVAIAGSTVAPVTALAEQAALIEEVTVTGTRITNPNLTQSSPVVSVDAETMEFRQVNFVEEFLREIPGAVPSIGAQVNNGNGGSTFVNLRGLGSNRNITLLNGVRVVPADLLARTNLDIIPVALLERTDVLTGGAGSAYGADAISGVINFITRRDFEGVDIRLTNAETFESDGETTRLDLTIGGNFNDGKGNAVLSLGYTDREVVFQGDRDFGLNNLSSISGNPGGSSTTVPSVISVPGTGSGTLQIAPDGQSLVPFYEPFNFNPFNIFQLPLEQYRAFGQANYEISDGIEWYSEMLYAQSTNTTIIAPSGTFRNVLDVPLSNPFMPAGIRNQICGFAGIDQAACDAGALALDPTDPAYQTVGLDFGRRFVELGTRNNERQTRVWQFKTGIHARLTDDIDFEMFYAYGESDLRSQQSGNGTRSRLQQALLATDPNTCLDPSGGCAPIDLFGPLGSISPAVGAFLDVGNGGNTFTELEQAQAFVSGDAPFAIPTTDAPISFSIGLEYREYVGGFANDLLTQTPAEVLGNGAAAPNRAGEFDVSEVFAEFNVPILQGAEFAEELTLQLGGRLSDYSTTGVEETWKIGGTWSPVIGVQFRGNYQGVTRAPNINELFAPQVTGLNNFDTDPCAGAAPLANADLQAICVAQGAPSATIGNIIVDPAGQVNVTSGGNPDLAAENADTWTLGVVLQPESIPDLAVTLDYYYIEVTDAITTPTAGDAFAACFGPDFSSGALSISGASASNPACTGIRRNPATGNLFGDVSTTFGLPLVLTNQGTLETDGWDLSVSYGFDLMNIGRLRYTMNGNYTMSSKFQASPTAVNRDCVGFYSVNCGSLQPEYMLNQRATLQTTVFDRALDVSLLWRYIDEMEVEPAVANTFLEGFREINAEHYFDLTLRGEIIDSLDLTVAVLNLMDNEPKVVGSNIGSTSFNTGNVYPSTYDPLGRRYSLTLRYRM